MPTTTSTTTCPDCDGCIGSITVKNRTLTYYCASLTTPTFLYSVCAGGCYCEFQKFVITALPAHGILKLNGTQVTLNQELTAEDNGKLVYVATSGYSGNDSFTWKVYLSCGTSDTATVNIIVTSCPSSPCCT